MGFFDTGPEDRVRGKRTQPPHPVFSDGGLRTTYVNDRVGRQAWESIGINMGQNAAGQYLLEPQGMMVTGNNLYSALQRDFDGVGVVFQMYGWLDFPPPNYPRVSPGLADRVGITPDEDPEGAWIHRRVLREVALDQLEPFARGGGSRADFIRVLGEITGYDLIEVYTVVIVPVEDAKAEEW